MRSRRSCGRFALESASQFRAEGPPDLTSFAYARDLNEVKALGSAASLVRTAEQTDLARFHTEPPPRFWTRNMRRFATDGRSVQEHARLMALLWVAQADASRGLLRFQVSLRLLAPAERDSAGRYGRQPGD